MTLARKVAKWSGIGIVAAFLGAALSIVPYLILFNKLDEKTGFPAYPDALGLAGGALYLSIFLGVLAFFVYFVAWMTARAQESQARGGARVANWSGVVAVTGVFMTIVSGLVHASFGRIKKHNIADLPVATDIAGLILGLSVLAVVLGFIGYVVGRIVAAAKSEG